MIFYWMWLKKLLFSFKAFFQLSSLFSLVSLILATAVLTLALFVVSSFYSGLEKILIEKQGHLRLLSKEITSKENVLEDISTYQKFLSDQALFFSFEGLILKEEFFKGVFFEAIQDEKLRAFSFIKNRILEGSLDFKEPFVLIGSHLAKELKVSSGQDVFLLAPDKNEESEFSKIRSSYKLAAILDFGHFEQNSRWVLMPLSDAEIFSKSKVSGITLWLKRKEQTNLLKSLLKRDLGDLYFISSWRDQDSFFEDIESDKKIIFFVLIILIIAAGFNISSSLFVQVSKKTKDINILKAMGATKATIRNIFLIHGFVLGSFGSLFGLLFGLVLCYVLVFIQNTYHFLPSSLYKVNEMVFSWNMSDMFLIFTLNLTIVLLSSFFPSQRAYKMVIKAGLSNN